LVDLVGPNPRSPHQSPVPSSRTPFRRRFCVCGKNPHSVSAGHCSSDGLIRLHRRSRVEFLLHIALEPGSGYVRDFGNNDFTRAGLGAAPCRRGAMGVSSALIERTGLGTGRFREQDRAHEQRQDSRCTGDPHRA
jgi:hypothetical protein